MNVRRLEKLAAHLESVPRRGFDMTRWVRRSGQTDYSDDATPALRAAHKNGYKCGMAACLGGHAAIVLPRVLRLSEGTVETVADSIWEQEFGSDAIATVFGICEGHAERLTRPTAPHKTPEAAARAIRKLIKENPPCCSGRLR